MRAWIIAGLVLGNVVQANAATEKFLCAADMSTGFKWNGAEWQSVRFRPDEKYTIARDGSKFVVTEFGKSTPEYSCESENLYVVCQNGSGRMIFNGEALRFAHYFTLGYTSFQDSTDISPSITLGRCTRL